MLYYNVFIYNLTFILKIPAPRFVNYKYIFYVFLIF